MAASAPIAIKNLGGDAPSAAQVTQDAVSSPPDPFTLWRCILQLQNTLNAVISKLNAHYHAETLAAVQVWSGGIVTAGSGLSVNVSAGELRKVDGTFQAWTAATNTALATANGSNPRIDLIQVATANGTVSKKDGTAAATPVAPAVDAGNLALATVLVPTSATVPSTITDVRARPGVETGGAMAPALQVDGTSTAATNLFTSS